MHEEGRAPGSGEAQEEGCGCKWEAKGKATLCIPRVPPGEDAARDGEGDPVIGLRYCAEDLLWFEEEGVAEDLERDLRPAKNRLKDCDRRPREDFRRRRR